LISLNINVFPEVDACHYIENTQMKHIPMEFHTYKSLATFCLSYHFKWNRLNGVVDRRKAIINFRPVSKNEFGRLLITPLRVLTISEEERGAAGNSSEQLTYKIDPAEQDVS
jgi:hypothetical protein